MTQAELHDRLEQSGFWRPFAVLEKYVEPQPKRKVGRPKKGRADDSAAVGQKYTAPYKLGAKAYRDGYRRASNPYRKETKSFPIWLEGWQAAREAKRKHKK